MKKRNVVLLSVIVVLTAIIIISGKFNQSDDTQESSLHMQYAAPLTIAAAPVYVADAKGLWDDQGLAVNVTYFDSGRKALDALLSKDAEVMSVSETPPLRSYLSGSKINVVATVAKHREAKMTIRTDKITKPSDVKGKKIGTVAGTNSDYYMYRWLEANHISPSEVEIIPLDASALSQAFVQGNIDVMFAWEPYNYNASSQIPSKSKSWPTKLYSGRHTIVMNTDYARSHSAETKKLIKGFIAAEKFIKENPDEAKAIVRNKTGMSQSALDNLWSEYTYTVGIDDEVTQIINDEASWAKSNQESVGGNKAINLIDPTFLLSVDADRVGKKFQP